MKHISSRGAALVMVLGLMLLPRPAYGVGYEVTEHDAKAMGLASAFVAWADNPSAIYYNPAGLTQIGRPAVSMGVNMIDFNAELKSGDNTEKEKTDEFYIPYVFSSIPIGDDWVFGVGVYSPYGLATEWDKNGITKYAAIKSELKTIFITPTLAWKPSPKVSVGAGVSYIYAEAEMTRKYPFSVIANGPDVQGLVALGLLPAGFSSADADVEFTGEEHNWGWNAGVLAKPTDNLSLGFSYRSETVLEFEGDMEVTNISPEAQVIGQLQGVPLASSHKTDAGFEIPLPHRFSLGIAYKLLPNWRVEVDYERVLWGAFDNLTADVDDENIFFSDIKTEKDWRDTNAFKLGTEVSLAGSWALRAGSFYYESPVPDKSLDPMIPDSDHYGFALGAGYQLGGFNIDIGYMEVFAEDRSVNNDVLEADADLLRAAGLTPGRDRYEHHAREIAVNLSYIF